MEFIKTIDPAWLVVVFSLFFLVVYAIASVCIEMRLARSLKTQKRQFQTILEYQKLVKVYEEKNSHHIAVGEGEHVYGNKEAIDKVRQLYISNN